MAQDNIEDKIGYDPYGVSDDDIAQAHNDVRTVAAIAEEIGDIISNAKPLVMSSDMVKINKEELLARVDLLRRGLPDQLARADQINKSAQNNLLQAKERAGEIIQNANNRAEYLASNENIVNIAKQKAVEIIENAKHQAKILSAHADQYCANQLDDFLKDLDTVAAQTRAGRAKLSVKLQNAKDNGLLDE